MMNDEKQRYLPPGSMTKARLGGVVLGIVLALLLVIVMALIVIAAKVGNGYGNGCCGCCVQSSCAVVPSNNTKTFTLPDRQADPEIDLRGRPLPHRYTHPDPRIGMAQPPCGRVQPPPLVPWWPDWRGKDDATTVPEPGSLALVALGGLLVWRMA